jgi:dTDP-4-amino-4,6-dideoxygalactose transaminase
MIIPFFSIDLKFYDLLKIILCIFYPFNKNKLKQKLIQKLKLRFPKQSVVLLPSARLGFYLTLKKYFKEGDEIIFSSMSFPLYVKIANQLKLKVILVDVEKKTLNIDYLKIEEKINSKTKGIVATHLFGYPCKILEISDIAKKYKLFWTFNNIKKFNFTRAFHFKC